MTRDDALSLIARRGNTDGTNGGLLDLLIWSGKMGLYAVTDEDVLRFWADPSQPYEKAAPENN